MQWTVTNRASGFWCGHQLFDDPGDDWSGWLAQQWDSLGLLGAAAALHKKSGQNSDPQVNKDFLASFWLSFETRKSHFG